MCYFPLDIHSPVRVSHRAYFLWCPVPSSLKASFLRDHYKGLKGKGRDGFLGDLQAWPGPSSQASPGSSSLPAPLSPKFLELSRRVEIKPLGLVWETGFSVVGQNHIIPGLRVEPRGRVCLSLHVTGEIAP